MDQEGAGKWIKNKREYYYHIEKRSSTVERKLEILRLRLNEEYNKIDFKNDLYSGVKLEAVFNQIIGEEIEKTKKQKSSLKTEKKIKEAKEYLEAIKGKYPTAYEDYNIKIKNKIKAKYRKTKKFLKQFTL